MTHPDSIEPPADDYAPTPSVVAMREALAAVTARERGNG